MDIIMVFVERWSFWTLWTGCQCAQMVSVDRLSLCTHSICEQVVFVGRWYLWMVVFLDRWSFWTCGICLQVVFVRRLKYCYWNKKIPVLDNLKTSQVHCTKLEKVYIIIMYKQFSSRLGNLTFSRKGAYRIMQLKLWNIESYIDSVHTFVFVTQGLFIYF